MNTRVCIPKTVRIGMYIHVYSNIHILYTYTNLQLQTCICVHMCVCIYVCMNGNELLVCIQLVSSGCYNTKPSPGSADVLDGLLQTWCNLRETRPHLLRSLSRNLATADTQKRDQSWSLLLRVLSYADSRDRVLHQPAASIGHPFIPSVRPVLYACFMYTHGSTSIHMHMDIDVDITLNNDNYNTSKYNKK